MNTATMERMNTPAASQKTLSERAAGSVVDRLGQLQADIAEMKSEEEQLKEKLRSLRLSLGQSVIEGELFRATVSSTEAGTKTDWAAVSLDLAHRFKISNPSYSNAVERNTQETEAGKARVSIKARKGE